MRKWWQWAKQNPVFPWVLAFVIGGVVIPQHGDQLELPRMLTMRAMADDHTFQIGRYLDWTDEWSRTPDGRYYNNRPPGPVLIPFPVFYIIDRLVLLGEQGKVDDQGRRPWPGRVHRATLSFLFQTLPFSILVMVAANYLVAFGVSLLAVHFFALAALFGNTAALFFNHWSGHGLTATFILGMTLALLQRRWFWVGFSFGFALLCEYPVAMILPPLLVAIWILEKSYWRWLKPFVLGGILPGLLWVYYHTLAFGSPFRTSNHFQNPMYHDVNVAGNFLNIMKPAPDWVVLGKLIFGAERGLLPTQPWLVFAFFFVIALFFLRRGAGSRAGLRAEQKALIALCVFGQIFLLYMNASFGGWHAGNTAGPRYMAFLYPVWGFLVALVFDRVPQWCRWALLATLGIAIVFRGLVFAVNPMIGLHPLWKYLWLQIVEKETWTNWMRLGIYWSLLGAAARMVITSSRAGKFSSMVASSDSMADPASSASANHSRLNLR